MRSYEMFSTEGDAACDNLVVSTVIDIEGDKKQTLEGLTQRLQKGIKSISKKHPEVYDSKPPYHIARRVNKALEEMGYSFRIDSYDISL
jgi:hypothetical protein